MPLLQDLKIRVATRSRRLKNEHFRSLYRGGAVLDVGVQASGADHEGINLFLREFPFAPELYTGLAIEDVSEIAREHPGKRFVTYDGGRFPFPDKTFDWAFSNAVVEHVGDEDAQVGFVNEMLRVARHVFFTTPNKYFPIESHTNAVLRHWLPGDSFFRWCARHHPHVTRDNLDLFDRRRLDRLMQRSAARAYTIHHNRVAGWTMTFTVVCSDRPT